MRRERTNSERQAANASFLFYTHTQEEKGSGEKRENSLTLCRRHFVRVTKMMCDWTKDLSFHFDLRTNLRSCHLPTGDNRCAHSSANSG